MRPRPNFFIAGALKCGTTSLFIYLRAHQRLRRLLCASSIEGAGARGSVNKDEGAHVFRASLSACM